MISPPHGDARIAPSGRHARLARYALWQARDYAKDRAVPTVIVSALTGYLGLAPLLPYSPLRGVGRAADAARLAAINAEFLHAVLGTLIFVGALFAMNGIVANDRKQGYYRFLFSKPVSASRYYGQAFLVHWAGFVAVMVLLALSYGALVGPVLSRALLVVIALMFLAYAGIAFLLSAAARWDWLSLVAVSIVATLLWSRFGESRRPVALLLYLLPPLHRADEVYSSVAALTSVSSTAAVVALPWPILAWLAGYGAVCFVAGLVVLRYRRLAIV